MLDILGLGEPLMEFGEVPQPARAGAALYQKGFGGDVSNMAVAAARQGAKAAIFTALGDDQFATDFLNLWDREGVDRSSVIVRSGERTGIYFIGYGPEGHVFSYFRKGSAASQVTTAELPLKLIAEARLFYVSAISQAISENCADACLAGIRHARSRGTLVCYNTNLRLKLWPLERARNVIHAAIALADIVRGGGSRHSARRTADAGGRTCWCKIPGVTGTLRAAAGGKRLRAAVAVGCGNRLGSAGAARAWAYDSEVLSC